MNDLMNSLMAKLQSKTITAEEKELLFSIAFGDKFMSSDDKGSKQFYNV